MTNPFGISYVTTTSRVGAMALRKSLLGFILILAALAFARGSARAQGTARGETLFEICATCHGEYGEGIRLFAAPAIAGMGQWYIQAQLEKFRTGARGAHPDDVEGLRMRPMSRTLRTEEDVAEVAAYVASLSAVSLPRSLEGDPQKGKVLYTTCATCHGANGEGNRQLFGPSVNRTSDWYLLEQLKKYKSGVRGGNPKDTTGIMMRPMALVLPDEQAMQDVVAYMMTLAD